MSQGLSANSLHKRNNWRKVKKRSYYKGRGWGKPKGHRYSTLGAIATHRPGQSQEVRAYWNLKGAVTWRWLTENEPLLRECTQPLVIWQEVSLGGRGGEGVWDAESNLSILPSSNLLAPPIGTSPPEARGQGSLFMQPMQVSLLRQGAVGRRVGRGWGRHSAQLGYKIW